MKQNHRPSRGSAGRQRLWTNWRTRGKSIRAATIVGLVVAVFAATPGVASADQFRNGRWVYGSIEREFIDFLSGANQFGQGGTSSIGEPSSDELLAYNDGRWQEFGFTNRIYWSPNVDQNRGKQIGGLILARWAELQFETAFSTHGYPTTRELPANGGRFNHFQRGSIYYKNNSSTARSVYGQIHTQWSQSNWENGTFGFPIADSVGCTTPANRDSASGRGQLFERGELYEQTNGDFHSGVSSVTNNSTIFLQNDSALYSSNIAAGATRWNGTGRIQFVASPTPSLRAYDVNIPNNGKVGLYTWREPGQDEIYLNTAYMKDLSAARRQAVATHELGHSLGLSHSCTGQLMSIAGGSTGDIGRIDLAAYRRLWG